MIITNAKILFYRRSCPVIFQKLESDPYADYCIQYAGNGHYFKTTEAAQEYIKKRFKYRTKPA